MSLVVTCPGCGRPTPVDLTPSPEASAGADAERRGPRCVNCHADVSGALGPADADTALDSYAPFGTAVMKRPNVEAILAGHATPEIAHVNPDVLPLGARGGPRADDAVKVSSPLTLASTVAAPSPAPLVNTLQSRHDSVAYAEQLRARLPSVDVVSAQHQPAPDTIQQTPALAPTPALSPAPHAAEAAGPRFDPAASPAHPDFQAPMPPLGSPAARAGLHWAIWALLLVLVVGSILAVVGLVLLGGA